MTGGTESQSISRFHSRIECTPEQNTRDKSNGENG